jgi:hypothetical protein
MMIAAVREKIITTSLHPSVASSMGDGTRGRLSGGVAQGQRRAKFHVRSHFGLGGCFSFRSPLHRTACSTTTSDAEVRYAKGRGAGRWGAAAEKSAWASQFEC